MATIRDRIRELSQNRAILIDDTVEVVQTRRLTPGFQRVTLAGPCLAAYTKALPADAFKIDIAAGEGALIRGFTVRTFDPVRLRIEFDVALHDGGPASRWSEEVEVGTPARFLGFRRDFALGDDVSEHVIITDASGLPAVAAILEALPMEHRVTLLAETSDVADRALLDEAVLRLAENLQIHWIVGAPSRGADSPLSRAAAEMLVSHDAQVWLAAESATVRTIRRHLLHVCGVPRGNLHATAYWIAGITSSERDDREAVVYGEAVDAGLDVMDPAVYDRIEFEDQPA